MKLAITIFLILGGYTLIAQPLNLVVNLGKRKSLPQSDTIYYHERLPLWPDFKATPQSTGIVAAITSSGFGYDAGMQTRNGTGTITINVYSFFNKTKSWVKPDKKTAYILNHEQLHFTVSHIGALLFVQRLKQARFAVSNYSQLLSEMYTASYNQMQALQNQYDGETRNGMLRDKQAAWSTRIIEMRNSLEAALR